MDDTDKLGMGGNIIEVLWTDELQPTQGQLVLSVPGSILSQTVWEDPGVDFVV